MSGRTFVDTNVLIYAHDLDAGKKKETAAAELDQLWTDRSGVISVQVLQEFYVNVTRKISQPISRSDARDILSRYSVWVIEPSDAAQVREASMIEEQYRVSFWDALIVVAARRAGASRILSEDLAHGMRFSEVEIVNPFLGSTEP